MRGAKVAPSDRSDVASFGVRDHCRPIVLHRDWCLNARGLRAVAEVQHLAQEHRSRLEFRARFVVRVEAGERLVYLA